jgi:hypothetical protein
MEGRGGFGVLVENYGTRVVICCDFLASIKIL